MPYLTPAMEAEYDDLINEAEYVTPDGPTRRMYQRTIWTQRILYQMDPYWGEQMPPCITTLKYTWIIGVVHELAGMED